MKFGIGKLNYSSGFYSVNGVDELMEGGSRVPTKILWKEKEGR